MHLPNGRNLRVPQPHPLTTMSDTPERTPERQEPRSETVEKPVPPLSQQSWESMDKLSSKTTSSTDSDKLTNNGTLPTVGLDGVTKDDQTATNLLNKPEGLQNLFGDPSKDLQITTGRIDDPFDRFGKITMQNTPIDFSGWDGSLKQFGNDIKAAHSTIGRFDDPLKVGGEIKTQVLPIDFPAVKDGQLKQFVEDSKGENKPGEPLQEKDVPLKKTETTRPGDTPDKPAESTIDRIAEKRGPLTLTDKDVKDLADDLKKNLKEITEAHEISRASDGRLSQKSNPELVTKLLSVLSKADIAKLDTAFGGNGVADAFRKSDAVPDRIKDKLEVLNKGFDARQADPKLTLKLAELAIKNGNITDFTEAFAGSTPEARKAFLENKDNNPHLGQQAIDKSKWSAFNKETASEFVRNGRISTSTEVNRETGGYFSFTNYEGVERSLRNLPPAEAERLARGAKLKDSPTDSLNDQQRADLLAYKDLHGKLKDAAGNNTVRLAYWDSLVQNGGQSNRFLDSVAAEGGRVWNGNPQSHLQNNWDKQSFDFYNDKQFGEQRREATRNVLSKFSNGTELIDRFNQKVNAKSFEESQKTGRGDLLSNLSSLRPSSSQDRVQALDELVNNKDGHEKYRTDDKYRANVDRQADILFGKSPAREEVRRALDAVKKGETPANDLLTSLRSDLTAVDGRKQSYDKPLFNRPAAKEPADVLRKIETGLDADKSFRDRITNPKTEADQKLRKDFSTTARELLGKDLFDKHFTALEKGEKLSPQDWAQIDKNSGTKDHRKFFQDLDRQPQEVKDKILANPKQQDALFGHLDKDNRQVATEILKHGYRPADKFQAARLNGDESGALQALNEGSEQGIGKFKEDFSKTYGIKAEDAATKLFTAQNGINAERTLAGDQSVFGQFKTDLKIREDLKAPIINGISRLFSNTPYREEHSFQHYTNAVAKSLTPDAKPEALQEVQRKQGEYRENRDAQSELETAIVKDGTNALITVAGGVLTGGAGFGLALTRAALLKTATIVGTGALANPALKHAGLGRLYDSNPGNVLKDSAEGALGIFFGGGNLKDLGLKGLYKGIRADKVIAEKAFNTLAYPTIANTTTGTLAALRDGKDLPTALLKGAESGLLAPIGVHSGFRLSQLAQKAGLDKAILKPGTGLNTGFIRGVGGGSSKFEGKLAGPQTAMGQKSMEAAAPKKVAENETYYDDMGRPVAAR